MEIDFYRIRPFEPKRDAVLVNSWAQSHGASRLPLEFLPPDGVILERNYEATAAGWLYKSVGVGVCFLEHIHTRPGLKVAEAQNAIERIVEYMRFTAREDGYGAMIAHTYPAIAKRAEKSGWQVLGSDRVAIGCETGLVEVERRVA